MSIDPDSYLSVGDYKDMIDEKNKRINKLERERDELAAYADRCREFLSDMHTMPTEWTIEESQKIYAETPATSLTRRDKLAAAGVMKKASNIASEWANHFDECGNDNAETGCATVADELLKHSVRFSREAEEEK